MKRRITGGALLLGAVLLASTTAPARAGDVAVYPLEDVREGLTGYGLTVFSGAAIDTFGVKVLGVRRHVTAGGDMIVVELSGHGLETSSVAQGMSGSPVYVDGKLLGAVSSGWQGALAPIAGVTPARELLDVAARDQELALGRTDPRDRADPAGDAGLVFDATSRAFVEAMLGAAPSLAATPSWRLPAEPWPGVRELALTLLPPGGGDGALPTGLFVAVPGAGTAAAPASADATLLPGSACAVALVYGDAQIGAIGTTSLRRGDQVVMMGHPFLQLGAVDLPLATADITTMLPSRVMSFKIGGAGQVVGRVTRDVRAGLAGHLGQAAPTLPVDVTVKDATGSAAYHYEVALEPQLTPQLAFWCLYASVMAEHDDGSLQTVRYDLQTRWRTAQGADLPTLDMSGMTGGPGGVAALAQQWVPLLGLLMTNRHESVVPVGVTATLTREANLAAAKITGAHAPVTVAAGDVVDVTVDLAPWRGRARRETLSLAIPPGLAPGSYRIAVASAAEFFALDAQRAPGLFTDRDLATTFDLLATPRATSTLVAAVIAPRSGIVAGGRELANLPGSIESTLAASSPEVATPTMATYVVRTRRDLDVMLQDYAILPLQIRTPLPPVPQETRP